MKDRKNTEQKYWTNNELDLTAIYIMDGLDEGEDMTFEALREAMQNHTGLQFKTLEDAIHRVTVSVERPKHRRALELNEEAKKRIQLIKLQEKASKS